MSADEFGHDLADDVHEKLVRAQGEGGESMRGGAQFDQSPVFSRMVADEIEALVAERDAAVARTQQLTEALQPWWPPGKHGWTMPPAVRAALEPFVAAVGEAEEPK